MANEEAVRHHGSELPPQLVLYQISIGHYLSRALDLAAKLGIADLLKDGPRPYAELAAATERMRRRCSRVLRLLASVGVFDEHENGRFALTPLGELLRSGRPRLAAPDGACSSPASASRTPGRSSSTACAPASPRSGKLAPDADAFTAMAANPEQATRSSTRRWRPSRR